MALPNSSGLAPVISSTGIVAGNYEEWLDYFTTTYQSIFGADVYLGNDSQDAQLIAVFAQACSDLCASVIADYNSYSPATAQGAGLSQQVLLNGLQRLVPTYSTAQLTITGVADSVITNGSAIDDNNYIWSLPATVTIPTGGSIVVTGTCTTLGAISAAASTITGINTPTFGWQTVTNATATVGSPVETDAALRVRQAASVALPAQTIFEGIIATLDAVPGVTRVRGIENNTASTDSYSIPARMLAFIVEGGASSAIFQALATTITPGIPTYPTTGGVNETYIDSYGSTRYLSYQTPVESVINVVLTINPLTGWASSTKTLIQNALIAYFAALPIGANVSYFGLVPIAQLPGTSYAGTYEITGMTIQKNSGSVVSADIQLLYNEAITITAGNVTFSGV